MRRSSMLRERCAVDCRRSGRHIAYHPQPLREEFFMSTDLVFLLVSIRFETRRTVFVNLQTPS